MNKVFYENDKDRIAQSAATILSILTGEVPYYRSLGLPAEIDASAITGAQRLVGYAAKTVESTVTGAKVSRARVSVDSDGRALVRVVLED